MSNPRKAVIIFSFIALFAAFTIQPASAGGKAHLSIGSSHGQKHHHSNHHYDRHYSYGHHKNNHYRQRTYPYWGQYKRSIPYGYRPGRFYKNDHHKRRQHPVYGYIYDSHRHHHKSGANRFYNRYGKTRIVIGGGAIIIH